MFMSMYSIGIKKTDEVARVKIALNSRLIFYCNRLYKSHALKSRVSLF